MEDPTKDIGQVPSFNSEGETPKSEKEETIETRDLPIEELVMVADELIEIVSDQGALKRFAEMTVSLDTYGAEWVKRLFAQARQSHGEERAKLGITLQLVAGLLPEQKLVEVLGEINTNEETIAGLIEDGYLEQGKNPDKEKARRVIKLLASAAGKFFLLSVTNLFGKTAKTST